jgi:hypothetical protein
MVFTQTMKNEYQSNSILNIFKIMRNPRLAIVDYVICRIALKNRYCIIKRIFADSKAGFADKNAGLEDLSFV